MNRWYSEKDLAEILIERAKANRKVVLSSATAHFVGLKLLTASEKPTREEVIKLICRRACGQPCYECGGVANMIIRAYGERVEEPPQVIKESR